MLAGPPGLAVFDFDNTLVFNDQGEACMYYIIKQGMLPGERPEFWEALKKAGNLQAGLAQMQAWFHAFRAQDDEEAYQKLAVAILETYQAVYENDGMLAAYRWSAVVFAFQKVAEWEKISRYVFAEQQETQLGEQIVGQISIPRGIRIYKEIHTLIQTMQAQAWTVRIVTASPQEIIQAVISHWNLKTEQVYGMQLARNASDEYLPRILDPMPYQDGKIQMLYDRLGSTPAEMPLRFAAGDSQGDLSLLQQAGLGILIDRGYPTMRAAANIPPGFLIQPRFIQPLAE